MIIETPRNGGGFAYDDRMATPDWQLPPGVDRGLWDYLRSEEMVRGYDEQIAAAPLSRADVAFCEKHFPRPGRLIDLGCGTGRLCVHFATRGFDCVGVDLSDDMLAKAKENAAGLPFPLGGEGGRRPGEGTTPRVEALPPTTDAASLGQGFPSPPAPLPQGERGGRTIGTVEWKLANLVDLAGVPDASFDYAACLFSTLGMVRGAENRAAVLAGVSRVLKPGGTFVLHAHNRFFRGLGWKTVLGQRWQTLRGSPTAGDVTRPQAYGGAPLTLHHFTRGELVGLLETAGFRVTELVGVGEAGDTGVSLRSGYGFLAAATRGG